MFFQVFEADKSIPEDEELSSPKIRKMKLVLNTLKSTKFLLSLDRAGSSENKNDRTPQLQSQWISVLARRSQALRHHLLNRSHRALQIHHSNFWVAIRTDPSSIKTINPA